MAGRLPPAAGHRPSRPPNPRGHAVASEAERQSPMPESSVLPNSHTPEPLPGGGSTAYVRSTTTSLALGPLTTMSATVRLS